MIKNLRLILLIFLISNCGFKIVNNEDLYNFTVTNINVSGDKRIGFHIKSDLLRGKNDNDKIELEIDIDKNREIKEKNLGNEVTKYEIIINVKIDYNIKSKDKSGTFTISKRGNYVVQDQYSETIIQERSLIDNLSDKIVGEIRENLSKLTYDS